MNSPGAVDVVIVGAGPVGLTLANILGGQGVRTLIIEERETLIDYPRGVGLDDESLRTFQSIGLVDAILPHTVPNQILRFYDANRRLLAEMAPPDARFGWPKRNGFVQPMVDAELLAGLDRFDHVEVMWGRRMQTIAEDADGVTVEVSGPDGPASVHAQYVVGCDGGRSATRHLMGVSFDGTTSSTRWVVIDLANDPLGHPNSEVGADPQRPYASISIAHGIRRFEFMIHADETDEQAEDPEFVAELLRPFVPHPDRVDVIRRRSTPTTPGSRDPSARAACCWRATPRTSCRCGRARATTAASAMRSTSGGSSPRWSGARPATRYWTPTTPSDASTHAP